MNQPYRWRCLACDKPNEPLATSCSTCGFPARATGPQIARARAGRDIEGSPARYPYADAPAPTRPSPAPWSGWRKGVAIAGALLLALGATAWLGSLSLLGVAFSLLAFIFGALLLVGAWVPRTGIAADAHVLGTASDGS